MRRKISHYSDIQECVATRGITGVLTNDRAAPINARVEKVAHGPFFHAIWPLRAIAQVDTWFE